MRLAIKFFIFVLVLGLAGPFILKKPDGTPWMDARMLLPDVQSWGRELTAWWEKTKHKAPESVGGGGGKPTEVYRWRAEDGSWQFSDKPPVQGSAETIAVDPNANLIQGLPEPEPEIEPEKAEAKDSGINLPMPMTISPDKVQKLKQDAEAVQQLMDDRARQLDEL